MPRNSLLLLLHLCYAISTEGGMLPQARETWGEQMSNSLRIVIEQNFERLRCLHLITDEYFQDLVHRIVEHIPVYSKDLTNRLCQNYVIAIRDIGKVSDLLVNGSLVRKSKYFILSSPGAAKALKIVLSRELYLTVKVCDVTKTTISLPLQLGLNKNGTVSLDGRKLHVTGFHNPPFVVLKDGQIDGVEVRLVRVLAEFLNFSWDMRTPHDGGRWGQQDDKGRWTGLKGELAYGKTDIGIATLYLNQEHYSAFSLTSPYTMLCLTFLVPAPRKLLGNWDALLKPLNWQVWLTFAVTASLYTVILCVISRNSVNLCLLETIRSAALVSGPQPTGPISQRILFTTWLSGCFFMAGMYGSELSASLVAQSTEPPLRTLDDLARSTVKWGRRDTDLAERLEKSSNPSARMLAKKFQLEVSDEDIAKKVTEGNYAIFVHVLSDGYPSGAEFLNRKARTRLITLQECVASAYVSVGLGPDLPIESAANRALRYLEAAGLLQEWQARDVRKYGDGVPYKNWPLDDDNSIAPFTVGNLAGAFALFVVCNTLASIVFCGEIMIACTCDAMYASRKLFQLH